MQECKAVLGGLTSLFNLCTEVLHICGRAGSCIGNVLFCKHHCEGFLAVLLAVGSFTGRSCICPTAFRSSGGALNTGIHICFVIIAYNQQMLAAFSSGSQIAESNIGEHTVTAYAEAGGLLALTDKLAGNTRCTGSHVSKKRTVARSRISASQQAATGTAKLNKIVSEHIIHYTYYKLKATAGTHMQTRRQFNLIFHYNIPLFLFPTQPVDFFNRLTVTGVSCHADCKLNMLAGDIHSGYTVNKTEHFGHILMS